MLLLLLAGLASCLGVPPRQETFNLTIVHINDIHAHFEQTNINTTRCRQEDLQRQDCYGGIARVYSKTRQILETDPDALFLNAGDFYQGTVWYTKFKYKPMIEFGNMLNYTAMGLGNHDFDDSILGLAPFAEGTGFDLLAANIENSLTDGSFEENIHYNKSTVKTIRGEQVGIIGYITQSTSYNFPNGSLTFTDEVEAVQAEAKRLHKEGVKIIIALGHSGYEIDQELAAAVPELDLVVGGHSHTFLYTGPQPSTEQPRGEYPTFVENRVSGRMVPVVQAYCYTKYLGELRLQFNPDGELLLPVDGAGVQFALPHLLNSSVPEDPDILEAMKPWQQNLTEYKETVGRNLIYLQERGPSEESNIGDVICDALAAHYPDTEIAFTNNGGIRADLPVGNVTYEDILTIQPFDNTVDLVTMTGAGLVAAIELAAANIDPADPASYPGFGYQLAGLQLQLSVADGNAGSRVALLEVKGGDGVYRPVVPDQIYNVALPSFLAGGGSRDNPVQRQIRGIFDSAILNRTTDGVMMYDAVKQFFIENSPIKQEVEGRFEIFTSSDSFALVPNFTLLLLTIFSSIALK